MTSSRSLTLLDCPPAHQHWTWISALTLRTESLKTLAASNREMPLPSHLKLSVLDQSPIPEGSKIGDALLNSIDLARLADDLGYQRYWVAEHHGAPGLACASPEALIGPIAAATSRIRVGSGGIMLPHYSPLKVAETFGMLGVSTRGASTSALAGPPAQVPRSHSPCSVTVDSRRLMISPSS
jgi:hypothetical protein